MQSSLSGLVKHQYCTLTAEICFIMGHYRQRSRLTTLAPPPPPLFLFQNSSQRPFLCKGMMEYSYFTSPFTAFSVCHGYLRFPLWDRTAGIKTAAATDTKGWIFHHHHHHKQMPAVGRRGLLYVVHSCNHPRKV